MSKCEACGKEGAETKHAVFMSYEVHLDVCPVAHTDMNGGERPGYLCRQCAINLLKESIGMADPDEVKFYA